MKKGLSVLLIAAALFGFYGGAVNINDVLACKDYWEEKGEQTTADMNKLEDGLNQLKDNEQAYLDGKDQLADGEKALADGEKAYAEGQATLAKGEADYAAAPGKLAAGEKQLAAGEKKLADGYDQYAQGQKDYAAGKKAAGGLDTLISGLSDAKTGYLQQWQPGFEDELTPEQLAAYMAGKSDKGPGLRQARDVIAKTLTDKAEDIGLIETISGKKDLTKNILAAYQDGSYKKFDDAVANADDLYEAFDIAEQKLTGFSQMASAMAERKDLAQLEAGLNLTDQVPVSSEVQVPLNSLNVTQTKAVISGLETKKADTEKTQKELEAKKASLEKLSGNTVVDSDGTTAEQALKAVNEGLKQCEAGLETLTEKITDLKTLVGGRESVAEEVGAFVEKAGDQLPLVAKLSPELATAIDNSIKVLAANTDDTTNADYSKAITGLKNALTQLSAALDGKVTEVKTNKAALQGSFTAWDSGYKQLKAGESMIADPSSKLPFAFKNMLENETIRGVLEDKASALIAPLTLYSGSRLVDQDVDGFDKEMNNLTKNGGMIDQCIAVLKGIKSEVQQQLNDGEKKLANAKKQLAQGEKDLAAGKKELAKGYADYEAAPAKLADGRAQLADAEKQLADGRAQLEDGKAKLAEYEDGEQQVRDGLATLMSTEPDGGLVSILDRRNGDADFDNGDNHLELDEGLEAVEVGRGYQADSGVLITKEITNRAIGTAAGLGAAALAVLAAILSFLKKNKGAGISALLAAAAGGVGTAMGVSAGTEFSSIAGSLVGATPWVAFGILAGVAAVHAFTHFASKKA